jgi:hypothetical protein
MFPIAFNYSTPIRYTPPASGLLEQKNYGKNRRSNGHASCSNKNARLFTPENNSESAWRVTIVQNEISATKDQPATNYKR